MISILRNRLGRQGWPLPIEPFHSVSALIPHVTRSIILKDKECNLASKREKSSYNRVMFNTVNTIIPKERNEQIKWEERLWRCLKMRSGIGTVCLTVYVRMYMLAWKTTRRKGTEQEYILNAIFWAFTLGYSVSCSMPVVIFICEPSSKHYIGSNSPPTPFLVIDHCKEAVEKCENKFRPPLRGAQRMASVL